MSATFRAAVTILLTATGVWAQSPAPVTAPADKPAVVGGDAARSTRQMARPFRGTRPGIQTQLLAGQRLQEMETTLKSMHALLKKMQTKAAASKSKDSAAAANLEMWELMLAHLDKQFEQLRAATLERADLEARRAALYNQAAEKAAKEAQSAAGQTAPAPSTVPKE